jgi:hypothetical protein
VRSTTPTRGRPPQAYIMKVSWPIKDIPITSTKTFINMFMFLSLCPNSLFQSPILFSLRSGGGLRRSRWPCRPRITLRQTLPDGVPPGGAIQGDQREIAQNAETDGQTATTHGQTTRSCSATVIPPNRPVRPSASRTEALNPVSVTCGCVRVMAVKLSASTHFLATPLGKISG